MGKFIFTTPAPPFMEKILCLSWFMGKFFFLLSWLRHSRGKSPSLFLHIKEIGQTLVHACIKYAEKPFPHILKSAEKVFPHILAFFYKNFMWKVRKIFFRTFWNMFYLFRIFRNSAFPVSHFLYKRKCVAFSLSCMLSVIQTWAWRLFLQRGVLNHPYCNIAMCYFFSLLKSKKKVAPPLRHQNMSGTLIFYRLSNEFILKIS